MTKTVMVVDSSAIQRARIADVLSDAGYAVLQWSDGRDALSRLINGMPVDLIIADLQLLSMDGIEFALSIRQHPDHRFTPIVMLTNDGAPAAARSKRVVGVDVWLVKPFKERHLLDALVALLAARSLVVVEKHYSEAF